jgi:hypothetical protein
LPERFSIMTRSMVPIFSPSERRTGVPSTLSLAINECVSRVSLVGLAVALFVVVVVCIGFLLV